VFLAAQCLQEVREVGVIREVRANARQELLLLTRFDFPFFYEPWDSEGREASRIRSRAVQELARGWKEDPATLPWLKDRAARDEDSGVRQAAVQELARGWMEDPATLPLPQDRAARDEHPAVRQAAIQELALGWKEDPATLPLLRDCAARDENGMGPPSRGRGVGAGLEGGSRYASLAKGPRGPR